MPDATDLMGPLSGLGFGGLIGATVGYASKKVTKLVALVFGLCFILVQVMVFMGWIDVDWIAVQHSAEAAWTNAQGHTLLERAWQILTANLPFGGGFLAGFLVGFKVG